MVPDSDVKAVSLLVVGGRSLGMTIYCLATGRTTPFKGVAT